MAGARYGLVLGCAAVVFTDVAPQPIGTVVLWAAIAAQLACGAVVCWRRTALPFATAAFAGGALIMTCLVVLAMIGRPVASWPLAAQVLLGAGALVGPVLLGVESRVHHEEWQSWRSYAADAGVLDMIMLRHIPQLRRDGRSAPSSEPG